MREGSCSAGAAGCVPSSGLFFCGRRGGNTSPVFFKYRTFLPSSSLHHHRVDHGMDVAALVPASLFYRPRACTKLRLEASHIRTSRAQLLNWMVTVPVPNLAAYFLVLRVQHDIGMMDWRFILGDLACFALFSGLVMLGLNIQRLGQLLKSHLLLGYAAGRSLP